MKRILALACCACTVPTWAADVGIGVSVKSNDSTIYVPIDFDKTFRLEPFFTHSKLKSSSWGYADNAEMVHVGAGFFGLKSLGESVSLYYGGRLSYLHLDADSNYAPTPYQDADGDGYRVAPTFGFEYALNKYLAIGGEAGWFHEDISSDFGGRDETRSGTETRLILRLRF